MNLRSWKLALATAILAGSSTAAQGGLLPLSATVVPDGENYRYTYGVMLTSNSTLNYGDQFVIYDFAGLIPGSNDQPTGFEFTTMNDGGHIGRTLPNDNPETPNLVWTYTGDTPLIGQIGLGNFTAHSTNRDFGKRSDDDVYSALAGGIDGFIGARVTSPTVVSDAIGSTESGMNGIRVVEKGVPRLPNGD